MDPVAEERIDCEAANVSAVVNPVTLKVPPLAIVICGELPIEPEPDKAKVPAEISVLPVTVFEAFNVKVPPLTLAIKLTTPLAGNSVIVAVCGLVPAYSNVEDAP